MSLPVSASLTIPSKHAEIFMNSLAVDKELSPESIQKTFTLVDNGTKLRIDFNASDIRMLRVSMSSFFDMAKVVIETTEEFA